MSKSDEIKDFSMQSKALHGHDGTDINLPCHYRRVYSTSAKAIKQRIRYHTDAKYRAMKKDVAMRDQNQWRREYDSMTAEEQVAALQAYAIDLLRSM